MFGGFYKKIKLPSLFVSTHNCLTVIIFDPIGGGKVGGWLDFSDRIFNKCVQHKKIFVFPGFPTISLKNFYGL